jgi:hypothetical protein
MRFFSIDMSDVFATVATHNLLSNSPQIFLISGPGGLRCQYLIDHTLNLISGTLINPLLLHFRALNSRNILREDWRIDITFWVLFW